MNTTATRSPFSLYVVAVALAITALALVVTGLVMEDTGVEFGALAVIGAAWLVRDSARTPQATP